MKTEPSPASSTGAALWVTRNEKYTMATDLNLTSSKHPELSNELAELNADQQAIDRAVRSNVHW
jgi:hypothetical protein